MTVNLQPEFSLKRGDQLVVFSTKACAQLIALLALAPGGRRSRTELANALWPGSPKDLQSNSLRQTLHRIRKGLGNDEVIGADRTSVWLSIHPSEVDYLGCRELVAVFGEEELSPHSAQLARELWGRLSRPICESWVDQWLEPVRKEQSRIAVRLGLKLIDLFARSREVNEIVEVGKGVLRLSDRPEHVIRSLRDALYQSAPHEDVPALLAECAEANPRIDRALLRPDPKVDIIPMRTLSRSSEAAQLVLLRNILREAVRREDAVALRFLASELARPSHWNSPRVLLNLIADIRSWAPKNHRFLIELLSHVPFIASFGSELELGITLSLDALSHASEGSEARLRLMGGLGFLYLESGDYPRANQLLHSAVELAEELGIKRQIPRAYNRLGAAMSLQLEHKQGYEYLMKAIDLCQALGPEESFFVNAVRVNVLENLVFQGRFEDAAELGKALQESASESRLNHCFTLIYLGFSLCQLGERSAGIEKMRAGLVLALRIHFLRLWCVGAELVALVLHQAGLHQDAASLVYEISGHREALGYPRMLSQEALLRTVGAPPWPKGRVPASMLTLQLRIQSFLGVPHLGSQTR